MRAALFLVLLQIMLKQQERVDELLFQADRCGASLQRTRMELAGMRADGSEFPAEVTISRSLDAGVTFEHAEVEHSILLSASSVTDLDARMEASLLGRNVTLCRGASLPKTLRMIVGDNAEIKIP